MKSQANSIHYMAVPSRTLEFEATVYMRPYHSIERGTILRRFVPVATIILVAVYYYCGA